MLQSRALKFGLFCTVALAGVCVLAASATAAFLPPAGRPQVSGGAFYGTPGLSDTAEDITDDQLNFATGEGPTASLSGPQTARLAATGQQTGLSAGNNGAGARGWLQGFGEAAHEGERENVNGFEAGTFGVALGADTQKLIKHAVLGFGLSYGHTNVDADDINTTNTKINSYQASLYGDYDLGDRMFLRGMASYGFNTDDNTRHNALGALAAKGDYDASEYTLLAKAGRHFDLGGAVVTPNILARWINYNPDNYTETGAGLNDMTVSQKTMNVFEVGLGGDVAWKYRMDNGNWLAPGLHAGYRYDLVGDRIETTSAFTGGGGSFVTQGPSPARNRLNAGAGLSLYTTSAVELKISYDLDYKADYLANSGVARATLKF